MFGMKRKKDEPRAGEPKLHCSFCNKSQDDVRKLIAGPTVYICDECVAVCIDILNDAGAEQPSAERGAPPGRDAPHWPATVRCALCGIPVVLDEALMVEDLAVLCRRCVSAIQAAAEADAAPEATDPER